MVENISEKLGHLEKLKYLEPFYNIIEGWDKIIIEAPKDSPRPKSNKIKEVLSCLRKNKTYKKGWIQNVAGHLQLIAYPAITIMGGTLLGASYKQIDKALDLFYPLYAADIIARVGPPALEAATALASYLKKP